MIAFVIGVGRTKCFLHLLLKKNSPQLSLRTIARNTSSSDGFAWYDVVGKEIPFEIIRLCVAQINRRKFYMKKVGDERIKCNHVLQIGIRGKMV